MRTQKAKDLPLVDSQIFIGGRVRVTGRCGKDRALFMDSRRVNFSPATGRLVQRRVGVTAAAILLKRGGRM